MKRILLLIFLYLVSISCSTGNDPEFEFSIGASFISLSAGDVYQISTNGSSVQFESHNPYIATVNSAGIITAVTIGQTTIMAYCNGKVASMIVDVKPMYNTYREPCTDFTFIKNDVIQKFGEPSSEIDGGILYMYNATKHFADIYLFDSKDRMYASSALINKAYYEETVKFLSERYISAGEINGQHLFFNGKSKNDITMGVSISKMSGYELYQVVYMPYTKEARCNFDVSLNLQFSNCLKSI